MLLRNGQGAIICSHTLLISHLWATKSTESLQLNSTELNSTEKIQFTELRSDRKAPWLGRRARSVPPSLLPSPPSIAPEESLTIESDGKLRVCRTPAGGAAPRRTGHDASPSRPKSDPSRLRLKTKRAKRRWLVQLLVHVGVCGGGGDAGCSPLSHSSNQFAPSLCARHCGGRCNGMIQGGGAAYLFMCTIQFLLRSFGTICTEVKGPVDVVPVGLP